ncbi:MAG: Hsp20/alpha crystallin family protein [Bacteroidota bacterium]|nr:Hsp20/alpha crystallin family protein [Bacteroidota bacterium]
MNYKTYYPKRNHLLDRYIPFGFNAAFNNPWFDRAETEKGFTPRVDVAETETAFELHVALPGMEKEQIKVEVKDGLLTISGERKQITEEKTKFRSIETRYGSFSRSFRLGETANAASISAEFKNGILLATIPKKEIETKTKNVVEVR